MTWTEIGFLSAGVMLGGVYADLDGPFWGIFAFAFLVAFVLAVAVFYWRRRFS